nr:MAG TPA: hypothetical protein [Caudoviricetes sp.]
MSLHPIITPFGGVYPLFRGSFHLKSLINTRF